MAGDQDTSMNDAPQPSKTKQNPTTKGHEITTKTIKTPPFSYARLELIPESPSASEATLDILTVRSYITAALAQFLGLSGTAISVDILKVEEREVWLRVPREDMSPFLAAVGGWIGGDENGATGKVGWRVRGSGNFLSSLVGERGVEKIWSG